MWDVARAAGVSQATVSLALRGNGGSRVSEETVARIRRVAEEIGYRANATARALRDGHSEMIGLIGDQVASAPFAGRIVEGAQDRAWQDDQLLIVANTEGSPEIEHAAVERLLSHQVRRFIYASMYNRTVTVPEALAGYDVVVLNALDPSGQTWSVSPDEVRGGHEATAHLVAAGHERIGFINIETLESGLPAAVGRHEGYVAALEQAGLALDPELVRFGGGSTPDGYTYTLELMKLADPPTAIFCANDRTAWGAFQALTEIGARVPEDVSIVGFDNQDVLAPFLRPALTTMNLPFREMGWRAAELLLSGEAVRTTRNEGHRRVHLHCEIVERDSVRAPRRMR
ncbi:MAG: LacI family DNA-binding transcriptional regulator [Actinomycetota bacterium]|nr:LacI family DNA-binding transcriptional regulator [Actinomycetota bacterium]